MRWVSVAPRLRTLNRVFKQRHEFRIIGQAFAHQFEAADHGHQKVVEIVGDAAGELPYRLQLLRLKQGLASFFEFLLSFLSLGDIAGDLGEAKQLAGSESDGIDDDIGPKTGAVLADAPALLLELAFALSRSQALGWKPAFRSSSV